MTKPRRPRGRKIRRSNGAAYIVLSIAGAAMVFPFLWQLLMSVSTNDEVTRVPPDFIPSTLHWENYLAVFTRIPFLDQLGVTVVITIIRVVAQVVLCSLAGYAFARMRFRGKGVALFLVLSILMVPTQVFLLPQFLIIRDLGLLNTVGGIVLPGLFSAFGVFLMRQFFMGLPDELEEAARLDGANPFQIFWRVMLPLATPGISALVILATLWSWNDLLWPLIATTRLETMPLPVGLAILSGDQTPNYPIMMAASVLAIAPVFILFIVMQKRVIAGLAYSGLK